MTQIRYVHAGDLTTNQAHDLDWRVGEIAHRHQEIAIADARVIGSWTYYPTCSRGRWSLESSRTDVTPRFRRKGIARALWLHGVARWNPTQIQSTIGSDEGRDFLARMLAEFAYRCPDLMLWVKRRTEDEDNWDGTCEWAAKQLLRKLGDRARAAKQLEAKSPVKLLKGAA